MTIILCTYCQHKLGIEDLFCAGCNMPTELYYSTPQDYDRDAVIPEINGNNS